jgi:hypothetical protein
VKPVVTGWHLDKIRAALDSELWEVCDHDSGRETRAIGLGSVFQNYPSGKFYMPFACGNLDDCPVCQGTGDAKPPLKRRIIRKWKNENRRRRRLWVKRYGDWSDGKWPERVVAAADRLNKKLARIDPLCSRCGGTGSHEAYDDDRWREKTEEEFESIGVSFESSEADPTYLLAVEYRERVEDVEVL